MRKISFALFAVAVIAAAALLAFNSGGPATAAAGGPVILGGDDLTDHGEVDESTVPPTLIDGWLYIQKALENLKPNVTRPGNDGSVAVLGSADSTETSDDAGAAYYWAVPQVAGLTGVSFHEGEEAINQLFADLAAGTAKPAIIVISGTGADNDLSDDDDGDAFSDDEGVAVTNNATSIANFVNSGGGLMSHGSGDTAYGWLSALLPGVSNVDGCDVDSLTLTAAGQAAFPGLTNANITSGPCHSNFTGDLAGLQILATDGQNRNIIIGGANVKLPGSIDLTPATATNFVGTTHTVTVTAQDGTPPAPAVGATVTFAVTSGPNAGTSGTCSANADCTTDANGQVSFTYIGDGGVGTDTISASFVTTREVTESTLAQKTWVLAPTPTATPAPTPAPTATTVLEAEQLPATGGTPSDGSALPWLAAGVIAITSGGLALAYRTRRTR